MTFREHYYICDKPSRYYIDGKRVGRKVWRNLHFSSQYKFDCFLTVRVNDGHYIHTKEGRES